MDNSGSYLFVNCKLHMACDWVRGGGPDASKRQVCVWSASAEEGAMEILINPGANCLCQGLDPPLAGRGQSACLLSKVAAPNGYITSINFILGREASHSHSHLLHTFCGCVCSVQTDSSCFHWFTCDADLSLGGLGVLLVIYWKAVKSKTQSYTEQGLCDLWQGISHLLSSVFSFYLRVIILPCKAVATFKFNVSKSIVNSTHVY